MTAYNNYWYFNHKSYNTVEIWNINIFIIPDFQNKPAT